MTSNHRVLALRRVAAAAALATLAASCGPRFDRDSVVVANGGIVAQQPVDNGQPVDSGTAPDPGTTDAPDDGGVIGDPSTTSEPDPSTTSGPAPSGTTAPSSSATTSPTTAPSSSGTTAPSASPSATAQPTAQPTQTQAPATDPGPAPGVTSTKCGGDNVNDKLGCIKVGVLVPLTGAAPVPSDFESGVSLYWWEKAAKGGTHGRQVELVVRDTESKTATARQQAQKLIQEGVFTIVSLDRLEVQEAIGVFMEQAKVPHIMVQAPTPYPTNWTHTFTISIDHTVQGTSVARYWAGDLGAANKAKKVAFVREQTTALKPGTDAFEVEAAKQNLDVVAKLTIDPTQTSFTNTVLQLQQSGAEIVWLYMAPTPALTIMQQAGSYQPIWFANSISWNLDLAQTNPQAPAQSRAFSPWVSLQHPRAKAYRDAYQKYNGAAADDLGLASWGLSEVLDSVLERVGPGLGRTSFHQALKSHNVTGLQTWSDINFSGGPPYVGTKQVAVYDDAGTTWSMVGNFRSF